jgi:MFS family permease
MAILSRQVCQACSKNKLIPVCFVGSGITKLYGILFSNFWLLFIASFIKTGEVENEEDAKLIYSNVMIVSVVLGILIVPVVGKLSDKYTPKILLPLAFLVRFIGVVMFMFIKNPKSIYSYCVSVFLVMGTAMENVLVDCLLLRNAEREIRGVLYGTAVACGYIG